LVGRAKLTCANLEATLSLNYYRREQRHRQSRA
jgi:hypothetical protein